MIIYSCITNGYDKIPDGHYYDPEVKYVMYYDGEIEKKGKWEFIKCERGEPNWIKSYYPRCMSHTLFDEPHVWIDGCYTMPSDFVETSKDILQHELTLQDHPQQRSIVQEFFKLYKVGFATDLELYELAEDMASVEFKPSLHKQSLNCVIWRQNTQRVREWNEVYWNWYKNHCQRIDQITSSIAEQLVMRAHRVPMKIDWTNSTRQKTYEQTYTMYENHDDDNFINKICSILKTKPLLMGL